jgi:methionyl-tRNA formyltransferase
VAADRVVLLTSLNGELYAQARDWLGRSECAVARDIDDLRRAQGKTLLSYATSVIVPPDVLRGFRGAYNLHAASPHYPGRDPHHFAVYEEASRYGATLHVMTERVDEGPIVDVEWFDVPRNSSPTDLLRLANTAGIALLQRWGPRLQSGELPSPADPPIAWTGKKRKRSDFRAMCRLSTTIARDEFERRVRAFDVAGYKNLTVELHDRVFRIEKSESDGDCESQVLGASKTATPFTHDRYRLLLRSGLAAGFRFVDFADLTARRAVGEKLCGLRHDCDNDLVAAARLAEIEAEEGVRSTYFVMLRSALYNVLAPTNRALVERILGYGHWLGLHFDHSVVGAETMARVAAIVDDERRILSVEFGRPVDVVSFHQPGPQILDNHIKLNCLNTYDRNDMAEVYYASDSNLVFRGGEPERLFAEGAYRKIQILLHPEWWTKEPMGLAEKWNQMLLNNVELMQESLLAREHTFDARREIMVRSAGRSG